MRSAGKRAVTQADVRVKCAGERTGVRGGRIRVNVRVCQWGLRVNVRVREWLHECLPVLVHFHNMGLNVHMCRFKAIFPKIFTIAVKARVEK